MISTLLAFALLAPQSAEDARLHPAGADLFLAFEDVPGALAAYEDLPWTRFLREPAVQEALTSLEVDPALTAGPTAWIGAAVPELTPWLPDLTACSLSVSRAGAEESYPGLFAVLDLTGPERAEELVEALVACVEEPIGLTGALEGARALHLEGMAFPLWVARRGPRVLIGGGAVSPNDAAALLEGDGHGLDGDPLVRAALERFGTLAEADPTEGRPASTPILFLSQREHAFELLSDLDESAGLFAARLSELAYPFPSALDPLEGARVTRVTFEDGSFRNETYVPETDDEPVLSIAQQQLTRVAPGAFLTFVTTSLDGPGIAQLLSGVLADMGGEDARAQMGPLEEALGALGPRVSLSVFPLAGLSAPKVLGWVQADDAEQLAERLERALVEVGASFDGLETRTRNYSVRHKASGEVRTFPLTTIALPSGWWDVLPFVSASPSFTVAGDELLFSLQPTHLKRELKRLYGGRDDGAPGPFAAAGLAVPEDASTVTLIDWSAQLTSLLDLAGLVQMFASEWLPLDLDALPDFEDGARSVTPTLFVTRSDGGARTTVSRSPVGPEGWWAFAWAWNRLDDVSAIFTPDEEEYVSDGPPAD